MKFVALLRGINVGGNNIIKMTDLREQFESLGFGSVETYIQSGNVIFESNEKKKSLEQMIAERLSSEFKYQCRVLVRSEKELAATVQSFPKFFEKVDWKHSVIFLGQQIDTKKIMNAIALKDGIEMAEYSKGVLFWSAQRSTIGRSNMLKLSSKPEYQHMTVRNVNTVTKLLAKMR